MLATKPTLNTLRWDAPPEGQLAVDVFETDDAVVIQSAIAGITAKDLDIYLNADIVTIRGTRHRDRRLLGASAHLEECFWGTFSRSIVLPAEVNIEQADAELKDGVLTLTLPKLKSGGRALSVRST